MTIAEALHSEKRTEQRHARKFVIVGTIRSCEADPELEGCPIRCETINVSGHGMQFRSDVVIPKDTRLRVAIAYTPREIYSVEGQVRWSKIEDDHPTVGMELLEVADSDINQWLDRLQSNISS